MFALGLDPPAAPPRGRSLRGDDKISKPEDLRSALVLTRMDDLQFQIHPPGEDLARALMAELDEELRRYYPDELIHGLSPEELQTFSGTFLILWRQGRAIGCGALRPLTSDMAELKRMYIRPAFRGQRLGRSLLEELERRAGAMGVDTLRLETGEHQVEAVRLFESAGYRRIRCYGEYIGNPLSICYEKKLEVSDVNVPA